MKKKKVTINDKPIDIKISGWFEPYREDKTTLRKVSESETGVYLIRSKRSKKIHYIGFSSTNLYKTLYRHFQIQNDRDGRQPRTNYQKNGYEIKIIEIAGKYAGELEAYLRSTIKPLDDRAKYGMLPDQYYKKRKTRLTIDENDTEEIPF